MALGENRESQSWHWPKTLLLSALIAGGVLLIYLFSRDEALQIDSDLAPHASRIPDSDDNPWFSLQELIVNVSKLSDEEVEIMRLAAEERTDHHWSVLAEGLQKREAALEAVRGLSKETGWKARVVYDFSVPFDNVKAILNMATLIKGNAQSLIHQGRADDAAAEVMTLLRLAKRLEEAGGPLIHGLIALSISSMGENLLIEILRVHPPTKEAVVRLREEHQQYRMDPEKFADCYRAEYQMIKKMCTEIRDGKLDPAQVYGDGGPVLNLKMAAPLFQCNRSVNEIAAAVRLAIGDLELAVTARKFDHEIIAKFQERRKHRYRMFLSFNYVGEVLTEMTVPAFSSFADRHARNRALHDLVQIYLAAGEFQHREKRALTSLEELVPDYLAALPLDPFDGQAMRFNPVSRRVYSIGTDLIDSFGDYPQAGRRKSLHEIKEEPALELPPFH